MVSGNPGPITAQMGTQRNSNLWLYFIGLETRQADDSIETLRN